MEIKEYKKLIDKATTKDELQNITYMCLKEQGQTLNSKKYNKVIDLAIQRQISLGIRWHRFDKIRIIWYNVVQD